MKVKYDRDVDILYIRLTDALIDDSDETQPGLIIDYDAPGTVVGFEIMNASKKMNQPAMVQLEVARDCGSSIQNQLQRGTEGSYMVQIPKI